MQKEIEKILCNLIQQSLNLPDNYGKDVQGNVIPCVTIRGHLYHQIILLFLQARFSRQLNLQNVMLNSFQHLTFSKGSRIPKQVLNDVMTEF